MSNLIVGAHQGCLLVTPAYKVGDPPPEGYLARHDWARVQLRGGLRQRRCPKCMKWRFPQEACCAGPVVAAGEN